MKHDILNAALSSLCPLGKWTIVGDDVNYESVRWLSDSYDRPKKEDVLLEIAKLEEQWSKLEYKKLRAKEYPPLVDLADALYWNSNGDTSKLVEYMSAVAAVKEKYPKGV